MSNMTDTRGVRIALEGCVSSEKSYPIYQLTNTSTGPWQVARHLCQSHRERKGQGLGWR